MPRLRLYYKCYCVTLKTVPKIRPFATHLCPALPPTQGCCCPNKFQNYQEYEAPTVAHTRVLRTTKSNSFTGTNPKQLYGSQLNHPSFLCEREETLASQIKLEMGQSQTPRSKPTQNSQCIWMLVQILTVCYHFSLTLAGRDKLFRPSPGITWCILSPPSIRDLHQSAHTCASCGHLARFLPRPSLTWADA